VTAVGCAGMSSAVLAQMVVITGILYYTYNEMAFLVLGSVAPVTQSVGIATSSPCRVSPLPPRRLWLRDCYLLAAAAPPRGRSASVGCEAPLSCYTRAYMSMCMCRRRMWCAGRAVGREHVHMCGMVGGVCSSAVGLRLMVRVTAGNTVKRVVVIVAAALAFRTPMTPIGIIGSAIAIGGVLLYSIVKGMYPDLPAKKTE
jgi:hypothetical protein